MTTRLRILMAAALLVALNAVAATPRTTRDDPVRHSVDATIRPLMAKYGIPGMAVGVILDGRTRVFDYGVASLETRRPVSRDTLFEIGSISKTLTVTLAAYASTRGKLSFSDTTDRYLQSLRGTAFGRVRLLDLATHTPGGLPLQVPEHIHDHKQLIAYLSTWRATWPPGTYRTYSNIGIGTLGWIAARAMGGDFISLVQHRLFPALGMHNTFVQVPTSRRRDYAQGYTGEGKPIRMAPGVLDAEAYGVRTTAADLLRFVQANLHLIRLDPTLQHAIDTTHIGYYTAGPMTQDLIWEQYPWPVALRTLRAGNAPAMIFNPTPATAIQPPERAKRAVWINKTGSTNGFSAYVAFIPAKRLGIVILANRSIPIRDRVDAAYAILTSLPDE